MDKKPDEIHEKLKLTKIKPSYHTLLMDLIHYLFAPLILFCVPYTLDFLPYYPLFANGAGGIDIFELLGFQCFV